MMVVVVVLNSNLVEEKKERKEGRGEGKEKGRKKTRVTKPKKTKTIQNKARKGEKKKH